MEEDASRAEAVPQPQQPQPQQQQQQQRADSPPALEILIPSFTPAPAPSSPTPTGTLSRLGFKSPTSPTAPVPVPGSPGGQVSAITVVALLDKLVNMLEAVQDNQQRMEQRQSDLEGAVRVVQGDVTRLTKTHVTTSNSVSKLLERSRKVSGHLKEVRERLDKQAVQVKKLESNHSHLLKRNHFKVLIFQEDNEIPTTVAVKDSFKTPQPSQYDAESTLVTPSITGSIDTSRAQEEGLQTISLSSDDDDESFAAHPVGEEMLEGEEALGLGTSHTYERRSDRFKRSSLKKVDSLKKAFSRQSIEKKMTQITTKIVPPEKREKIKKSLTPNHPKSPTAKSSSFKVSPMTFNIKKVRDVEATTQDLGLPEAEAHVEIPPLGSLDGEIPLAEVHKEEGVVEEIQNQMPSTPESLKPELEINGDALVIECEINGDQCAGLAVPENDDDDVDEEEEEEEDQEKHTSPVETAPVDSQIPTATPAVEQVS